MTKFAGAKEAKEFLAGRIIDQAQREGISLSELERKMLYFSETDWAPPDITDTARRFESEYDSKEYERKITRLVRGALRRARREGDEDRKTWAEAIRILSNEDHYLLVMTGLAGAPGHPSGDLLRLVATAFAVLTCLFGLIFAADRLGFRSNESIGLILWATAVCLAVAYLVLEAFVGRERAQELLNRFFGFFGLTK